ncbi:hypothetical protein [Cupriavidus pampae]|uniref:Uncharacterized protein n=1 Tax=Cupriavidus pampae TaxID=659251 RepID=A0ABN7ZPR8_9BURK|nr:hypothetical protein [Cupriavidus pampae]CAG9186119.1 hypothetical protein LMG32289_06270 [Cupriavidus pampae]
MTRTVPIPRVPKDYEALPPFALILLSALLVFWCMAPLGELLLALGQVAYARRQHARSPLNDEEAELLCALAKAGGQQIQMHKATQQFGSLLNDHAIARAATGLSSRGLIAHDRFLRAEVTLSRRGRREGKMLQKQFAAALAAEMKVGDRVSNNGLEMIVVSVHRSILDSGAYKFGEPVLCEHYGQDGRPHQMLVPQHHLDRLN